MTKNPNIVNVKGGTQFTTTVIILSCVEKKYREILLITGKGIHSSNYKDAYVSKDFGKIKYSVQEFIKNDLDISNYIKSVSNADINDGGEGAILVKLKNL